jgi:hypothetical protein
VPSRLLRSVALAAALLGAVAAPHLAGAGMRPAKPRPATTQTREQIKALRAEALVRVHLGQSRLGILGPRPTPVPFVLGDGKKVRLSAAEQRDLAAESDAIVKYLAANWRITVGAGDVRAVVEEVLREGTALGDRLAKARLRERAGLANADIGVANQVFGTRIAPIATRALEAAPTADFPAAVTALEAALKGRFAARVRARLPDDEYATPTAAPFDGADLHPSIGGSPKGFARDVSPPNLKYNRVRGRSQVNTLIAAILRQGMSVRARGLEATHGARIDRAQARAGALLPDL